jgi:DNA-binding LytR/AlgR family response regulator
VSNIKSLEWNENDDSNISNLVIAKRGQVILIRFEEIIFLETNKKKSVIYHTAISKHTIKQNLKDIQDKLKQHSNFMRTHRSYLVNLDWVEKIYVYTNSCFKIKFRQYNEEALLSRKYFNEFKKRLGLPKSMLCNTI